MSTPIPTVESNTKEGPTTRMSSKSSGGKTTSAGPAAKAQLVAMCRPSWDREDHDEDDEDGAAQDELDKEFGIELDEEGHAKSCYCGERWPWRVTSNGWKLIKKLQGELAKRDQDLHDMHIFNDFTGHGIQEVMENKILDFEDEMFKKKIDPVRVWAQIESTGMLLNMDMAPWYMTDSGDNKTATVQLLGTIFLTTLDLLKTHGLLKPDSPISNIPLIASLYLKFASEMSDLDEGNGEFGWTKVVVKMLDEADIKFEDGKNCARGTEGRVGQIREEMSGDDEARDHDEEMSGDDEAEDHDEKNEWESVDSEEEDEDGKQNKDMDDIDVVEAEENVKGKGHKREKNKKKDDQWSAKDDTIDGVRQWKKWDWRSEFREFVEHHGHIEEWVKKGKGGSSHASMPHFKIKTIGGDNYDITKMSKKERKQYELGSFGF